MKLEELFPDQRDLACTRIEQCHAVLLRMFKVFEYLCARHNIEYFLCSGTLKAAVVYKGFKPWDDDFDVGMTRENYEKFVEYAVPELPLDIFFQTPETDRFFPVCHTVEAKLRDRYSSYTLKEGSSVNWHNGLMLDILVFDKAFLPHNIFIYLLNRILKFFYSRKGNNARARVLKWIARHSPFSLVYASSYISRIGMVAKGANYFREEEIGTLIKAKFEGMDVFIPGGWDNYLKRRYGNYRQAPPLKKQKGHHSIEVPNPNTPCSHKQSLSWKDRQKKEPANLGQ